MRNSLLLLTVAAALVPRAFAMGGNGAQAASAPASAASAPPPDSSGFTDEDRANYEAILQKEEAKHPLGMTMAGRVGSVANSEVGLQNWVAVEVKTNDVVDPLIMWASRWDVSKTPESVPLVTLNFINLESKIYVPSHRPGEHVSVDDARGIAVATRKYNFVMQKTNVVLNVKTGKVSGKAARTGKVLDDKASEAQIKSMVGLKDKDKLPPHWMLGVTTAKAPAKSAPVKKIKGGGGKATPAAATPPDAGTTAAIPASMPPAPKVRLTAKEQAALLKPFDKEYADLVTAGDEGAITKFIDRHRTEINEVTGDWSQPKDWAEFSKLTPAQKSKFCDDFLAQTPPPPATPGTASKALPQAKILAVTADSTAIDGAGSKGAVAAQQGKPTASSTTEKYSSADKSQLTAFCANDSEARLKQTANVQTTPAVPDVSGEKAPETPFYKKPNFYKDAATGAAGAWVGLLVGSLFGGPVAMVIGAAALGGGAFALSTYLNKPKDDKK